MTKKEIKRSVWINASCERVWQAVNDPEQLAQWLLPPILNAQMKRDADGMAFILMGPMAVPIMSFEAAERPYQVTIRGFPDKVITLTYNLAAENDGTSVTVTMAGFESLSEDAYQEAAGPSGAGWEKALQNLKAYVEGSEIPFPQGYVAALLGYRREIETKYAVERTIWLRASRERVWQALTDPQEIQQWYSPTTPWRLSNLEVGGTLSTYDAETDTENHTQIIDIVDPPRQLVLRAVPEPPDTVHEVTSYKLVEENGGTRLILTNAGYGIADVRHQNMEQNAFGFGMALENLQAYLNGEDLPYPFGF